MALNIFKRRPSEAARSMSFSDWLSLFSYQGNLYSVPGFQQTLVGHEERIGGDFPGLVAGAMKSDGVVFACMLVRMLLFSEARMAFRRRTNGKPGDLFGTTALSILEHPEPGQTTGDLLARASQDVDLAGNFFAYRRDAQTIRRLRPDWVTIVLGDKRDRELHSWHPDMDVVGYLYLPGGKGSGSEPLILLPEQVAHFAPIPDPVSPFRGMSWLQPIVNEVLADRAATSHKLRFFENGATPNIAVRLGEAVSPETFNEWVEKFDEAHKGVDNAYKTLYLAGGADLTVVGANLRQLDFKNTQGAGETRIAAAAGVPPVIVGLSEGLQAATYSNYGQARRRFADGTIRPLWRNFAGSMERIIDVPAGAELWYDATDISFLAEDRKDRAEIQRTEALALRQLVDAGFTPASVIAAVNNNDWSLLDHTGLYSVQLQPAGAKAPDAAGRAAIRQLLLPFTEEE